MLHRLSVKIHREIEVVEVTLLDDCVDQALIS